MKNTTHSKSAEAGSSARSDASEVSVKGILIFASIVVAMVGGVILGIKLMAVHLEKKAAQNDQVQAAAAVLPAVAASRSYFPQPREQVLPHADLEAFQSREEAELNSYGWIDRQAGVVRIPIARAMELLAQKSLRSQSNIAASAAGPSSLELQQQRPAQTNASGGEALK
jgi:hypothetical protein